MNSVEPIKISGDRIMVDRKWIVAQFGISMSTCRRIIVEYEDFPKPCDFFSRVKRYKREDVEAWFDMHVSGKARNSETSKIAE